MLGDPSALGPRHPETCPGRDSGERNPRRGRLQAGAAGSPSRLGSNPSHLPCFLGKEENPGRRGDFFFFFFAQDPRFHGTQRGGASPRTYGFVGSSSAARGTRGSPSTHHGRSNPGAPTAGGSWAGGCCPDVPRCPQMGTACHDTGGQRCHRVASNRCVSPNRHVSPSPRRRLRDDTPGPILLGPIGSRGLRRARGRSGSAVSPANTVPARETKARLLTAGEERLSALLSPASQRVYSSCINLGDRGGGGGQGGGGGGLIFPIECWQPTSPLHPSPPPPLCHCHPGWGDTGRGGGMLGQGAVPPSPRCPRGCVAVVRAERGLWVLLESGSHRHASVQAPASRRCGIFQWSRRTQPPLRFAPGLGVF